MNNIKEQIGEDYMDKFVVNREQNLFGFDWSLLKKVHCPICFNKLYSRISNPDIFFCKSKKHKKRFIISKKTLEKFL